MAIDKFCDHKIDKKERKTKNRGKSMYNLCKVLLIHNLNIDKYNELLHNIDINQEIRVRIRKISDR